MAEETLHKMLEELGYLRGKVDGIDAKVTVQNGALATLQTKIARHDVVLGKFGAGIAILVFALSFGIDFIVDLIKRIAGVHS